MDNGKDRTGGIKRGNYRSYLSDPEKEVPRTTRWRQNKALKTMAETSLQPSELSNLVHDGDEDVFDESTNFHDCDEDVFNESIDDMVPGNDVNDVEDTDFIPSPSRSSADSDNFCDPSCYNIGDDLECNEVEGLSEYDYDPDTAFADDHEDSFLDLVEEETGIAVSDCDLESDAATVDQEEHFETNSASSPLFSGSRVTFGISMLLIITFAMRHSLTGCALADLLLLIDVHLISPNTFGKSLTVLRKFFKQLKNPMEYS